MSPSSKCFARLAQSGSLLAVFQGKAGWEECSFYSGGLLSCWAMGRSRNAPDGEAGEGQALQKEIGICGTKPNQIQKRTDKALKDIYFVMPGNLAPVGDSLRISRVWRESF